MDAGSLIWNALPVEMEASIPSPETLTLEDDDGILHVFRVTVADYNQYEKDGRRWLTFYCRADEKISPPDGQNPQPWLEINIPLLDEAESELRKGVKVSGAAYDDELGNLTNFYWYSHGGFESPDILIRTADPNGVLAEIRGEGDGSPVAILGRFVHNPLRCRSFS